MADWLETHSTGVPAQGKPGATQNNDWLSSVSGGQSTYRPNVPVSSIQPQVQPQPQPQSIISKTTNLLEQAGSFISKKLDPIVPGGTKAGLERVRQTPLTEFFLPTSSKVKKTISTVNKKLGPVLFSQYVPYQYSKPYSVTEVKEGVEPTAGKFVGGLIDDALMAYLPAGGVSAKAGRNLFKEGLNVVKGIKTAGVFIAFQGLLKTLKEEDFTLKDIIISGGIGFLLGSFEPQVMTGFPKTDIAGARNVLRKYGFKSSEFKNAEVLKTKFRTTVKDLHPDTGGNAKEFKVFVDAYNKVTSAGIDSKWKFPDIISWVNKLWDKQGETSEALYRKANTTFRTFLEGVVGKGGKTMEITPQQTVDMVVGSNLEGTSLGKIMLKLSVQAKQQGKNVVITELEGGIVGDNISETPEGVSVGVRIAEPKELTAKTEEPKPVEKGVEAPKKGTSVVKKAEQVKKPVAQGGKGDIKPEVSIKKLETNLKDKLVQNQEPVEEALSEVWQELDVAEAGQRIFVEDPKSSTPNVIGIKSTFPQWVPEELRNRKLFNKVMAPLANILETGQYPTGLKTKQRALFNAILDEVDFRAKIDTSYIRSDIMKTYESSKKVGETEKVVRGGAERGERAEVPKKPTKAVEPAKPVKVKPKAVSVPREQLPVGGGKLKASRLEARITESLSKTPQEIKDQLGSTFNQMNKKEQKAKAIKYITEKPEEAMDVLMGKKEAPKELLKNSIYVAMENLAKDDADLARRLSSLSSTRAGQELSILTEIDPDSPVKIMRDIVKVREEVFSKRHSGKKPSQVVKETANKIKENIKPPSKWDWNAFLDGIVC